MENCRRHGRAAEFVVMDDSPGAEAQDQTRAALQGLEHHIGTPIRYAGRREKSGFADALARESAVPSMALASFDHRHRFVGNAIYAMPEVTGGPRLLQAIASGCG